MMGEGVRKAILVMAETLAGSDNALAHFTCREADSIIHVVKLAGYAELAADMVLCHARGETSTGGDEDGDLHVAITVAYWDFPRGTTTYPRDYDQDLYREYLAREQRAEQNARALARQYVAGL